MPHTPGTWVVREKWYIGTEGGGAHAEVKCCRGIPPESDQHEANAKLIAAAPDLLAACQLMMQKIHEVRAEMRAAGQVTTNQDEAEVAMIQAAIDKATK